MSQTKQQHIKKIAILKTQNDRAVLDVTRVTVLFVLLPIAFPLCCFTGIPSPLAVPHVEPWFGLGKRVHPKNFVNLPECEQPQGVLCTGCNVLSLLVAHVRQGIRLVFFTGI